jgi:hypothetical protein
LTFDEVERAMQGADESGALRLYHNSPHDFDRFSMSQIGTGEGAQAYGHGLYFAESPSVSGRGGDYWRQFFNKMPSGPERTATGAMYANKFDPEKAALQLESNFRYHAARAKPGSYGDGPEVEEGHRLLAEENQQALDMIRSGKIVGPRTYEVNVNANPEDFLDWDKLLGEQSPQIRDAFASLGTPERLANVRGEDAYRALGDQMGALEWPIGADATTRKSFYSDAAVKSSEALREAGIPGIRYLDAGSRGRPYQVDLAYKGRPFEEGYFEPQFARSKEEAENIAKEYRGKGYDANVRDVATRNYVVFDENLIEIVRKYGIAGAAAMLGVSAVDVEEAIAQGMPPSQWDQLVVGPQ